MTEPLNEPPPVYRHACVWCGLLSDLPVPPIAGCDSRTDGLHRWLPWSADTGYALPECSFCKRSARWTVEGDQHAFRARGCARHAHQALDLALLAGNTATRVVTADSAQELR